MAPFLVGLGVTELSMVGLAIPEMKQIIRAVDLPSIQAIVPDVLGAANAEHVRATLSAFYRGK